MENKLYRLVLGGVAVGISLLATLYIQVIRFTLTQLGLETSAINIAAGWCVLCLVMVAVLASVMGIRKYVFHITPIVHE